MPAAGGQPVHVAEGELSYPDALPGGKTVVVTANNEAASASSGDLTIAAVTLSDGSVTKLFDGGTFARYVPTGHLAYLRNGSIMAAPFDAGTLQVGEARVPVITDAYMDHALTSGNFAISASGAIAYVPGSSDDFKRTLITTGTPAARPLLQTRFDELEAAISPDGQWIAYRSSRSGRAEIYVSAFPSMAATVRVSVDGGQAPAWAPKGRRLYFRDGRRIMAADLTGRGTLSVSAPVEVARVPAVIPTGFVHVMPDGRLLAIDGPNISGNAALHVIVNWFTELRQKVR